MFSKYYQSELTYLRETGREFGLANPSLAGLLTERGGDPDVERLLEGFAFLTARIRERADAAVPEVVQGLVELLLPHYLRPLPSCSIVEFVPQARALRSGVRVPRGTELASRPIDGTSCSFSTTSDLTILPLTIADASVEYPSATAPILRVTLQTHEQGCAELAKVGVLRFYLHGELSLTSTLLLWLLRYCRGIQVGDGSAKGKSIRLPPASVRAVGFDSNEALFPWPKLASEGYRLVQELFTLPEKFMFFELNGLGAVPPVKERLELRFEFERPPPLPSRVGRDAVRLHSVPIINLFHSDSEPIRFQTAEEEHLLRAAAINPMHMEIYSVDSVTGVRAGRAEREIYTPFVDFAHAAQGRAFYRLRRARSPIDDGIDTFIAFGTPRDVPLRTGEETVSLRLTCTNRSLPSQLTIGDLTVPTSSSPTLARFSNISPVTKPVRPPLDSEIHWRLLSHLSLTHRSLANDQALKALLGLYNFQAQGDQPTARANMLRMNAIRAVRSAPVRRFLQGAPVRGQRTAIELEETGFAGLGDLFLFGCILDDFFAAHLTLNSFHELSVSSFPSQTEYTWAPRSGSQPLV